MTSGRMSVEEGPVGIVEAPGREATPSVPAPIVIRDSAVHSNFKSYEIVFCLLQSTWIKKTIKIIIG